MSYLGLSEVPVDDGATFSWHSEQESMFQEVLAKLRARRSSVWAALLLVGSLVAFMLVQRSNETTLADVLILTGVLAFHEAGHFVAMRALGYRDVKMFFIPFFGAAVTGRRTGGAAWKEAPNPESTVVFLDHAGRRFLVIADGQYSTRFLESFRWNPEPQPP